MLTPDMNTYCEYTVIPISGAAVGAGLAGILLSDACLTDYVAGVGAFSALGSMTGAFIEYVIMHPRDRIRSNNYHPN